MNEEVAAKQRLRLAAIEAKRAIEDVLDCLGWPQDEALSRALDRLVQLKEQAQ
jgi:hypothetical protein